MTRCRISVVLFLVVAILAMVPLGIAQTTSTTSTTSSPPQKDESKQEDSCKSHPPPPQVELSLVTVVDHNQHFTTVDHTKSVATTTESELDRPITVALQGLGNWMAKTCKAPGDLRLYLAGHKLTQSSPTLASAQQEYVNFHLEIDPGDRDAWVQILYEARLARDHKIPLSVGWKDNMQAFDSNVDLALKVYPSYTYMVVLLLLAILAATLILSVRTDLLRDGTQPPASPARLPYNLGRVQMAFWFYLVITAYIYVWLITGEYNTVTNSVLALIGISAGTGVAAVLVDQQKAQDSATQRTDLETQQSALVARINDLTASKPEPGSQLDQELQQKKNSLNDVQAQLAHLTPLPPPAVSKGFLKDILSGGDGVGFHRFQMVVWTLVFGIIFIQSVYRELAMPNFDTSLLGLMGLSSGTYIGFKFPEKAK